MSEEPRVVRDVARAMTATGIEVTAWQVALARWSRLSGLTAQSPDWAAYVQGGEDVVDELGLATGHA